MAPNVVTCSICDRAFSKRFSLNRHMATVHQIIPVVARRSIMCPVTQCGSHFPYQGPLRAHLKDAHEITLEDIEISFSSMDEFFDWKRREEETFSLKYVKACGTQRLMDGIEVYRFNCFRTGMYNPEGKGLRRLKAQGSCKIGASCPSTITAHRQLDGKVTCSYCMTHVGHEITSVSETRRAIPLRPVKLDGLMEDTSSRSCVKSPSKISIPNEPIEVKPSKVTSTMLRNYQLFSDFNVSTEDRFVISSAISQNKTVDEIFDRVRKSVHGEADLEFDVLVNHLKSMNRYSILNDMTTDFQQLTEQCNASQETPVVFYEGLISDGEGGDIAETFILVVMNSYQVEILKLYGHQGMICVDPVYSMDDTGYIAIALYVWSSHSDWLLCSICFCQNFSYTTMKSFFNQVLIRTGAIAVKTVLTEDIDAIHTAWANVMGGGSEWILSPWHIDHKLRSKLKSLTFTDDAKLACLYRLVRCLIETTSEEKFNEHISFLSKQAHSNLSMASFNKFIHDAYIWRKYSWAKYCRSETERNALSLAEAAHLLAQRVCHGEDLNLGQTLFTVFQYYRTKCLTALMDSGVTLVTSEHGPTGHVTCPNLSELGDVYVSRVQSQKVWSLQIGETTVDVGSTGKSCSALCTSRCVECQVCVHRYRCSCVESVIQWNFCKHIHLIGHHLVNSGEAEDDMEDDDLEDEEEEENEDDDEEDMEIEPKEKCTKPNSSDHQSINHDNLDSSVIGATDTKGNDIDSIVVEVENLSQKINDCARSIHRLEDLKNLRKAVSAALVVAESLVPTEDDKPTDEVLLKLTTLEDHNYTL